MSPTSYQLLYPASLTSRIYQTLHYTARAPHRKSTPDGVCHCSNRTPCGCVSRRIFFLSFPARSFPDRPGSLIPSIIAVDGCARHLEQLHRRISFSVPTDVLSILDGYPSACRWRCFRVPVDAFLRAIEYSCACRWYMHSTQMTALRSHR
jgi:hypothetical protein